jgi:hypothetical protein
VHLYRLLLNRCSAAATAALLAAIACSAASAAPVADLAPQTPAAFLPGGMLGIQLGGSLAQGRQNPLLRISNCQAVDDAGDFDQVCFFEATTDSRVGGAQIHDGFIVGKNDHVVLVGTGISIKDADDPLADSVVHELQSQIHSAFQHTGDNVLFVKLPSKHMSANELAGFSETAPVLLVQLEAKTNELAVLYGFLAPVNTFGSLASD